MVATRAVMDPSTSAADLASIAQKQPSLRLQVAMHANAYPGLLSWLKANGDTATKQIANDRLTAAVQAPALPGLPSKMSHNRVKPGWFIGVAVVVIVVVVAVVLFLVKPWQTGTPNSPSGADVPVLTTTQFSAIAYPEDMSVTTEAMANQIMSDHPDVYITTVDDWDNGPDNAMPDLVDGSCSAQVDLATLGTGFEMAADGDSSGGNNFGSTGLSDIDMMLLFDTVQDAAAVLRAYGSCSAYGDGLPSTPTVASQDGVALAGYVDRGYYFAQYGNVVIFHDDGGSDISWADWQAMAPAFKQTVDTAVQG